MAGRYIFSILGMSFYIVAGSGSLGGAAGRFCRGYLELESVGKGAREAESIAPEDPELLCASRGIMGMSPVMLKGVGAAISNLRCREDMLLCWDSAPAVEITHDVGLLLRIAMLAGTNIAVEKGHEGTSAGMDIISSISAFAPEFSRIGVVQGRGGAWDRMRIRILKEVLDSKSDVAYIKPESAKEYGAELLICPSHGRYTREVMDLSRGGRHYICMLKGGIAEALAGKGGRDIEGLNSVDMVLTPSGNGFDIHELRWLSRAETEDGAELYGMDIVKSSLIGSSKGLSCNPIDTKCVRRYSEILGISPERLWNSF